MRNAIALAFAFSVLTVAPAGAQTIDFHNIKCSEVAALPDETLDRMALWLDGFGADDEDQDSMKVDLGDTNADDIKAYCQQHPGDSVLKAAEEADKADGPDK